MRRFYFGFGRLYPKITFCVMFLLGIFFGCLSACSAGQTRSSLMHMAILSPVSIVSLSAVMLLPFILAAIVVYFQHTWLLSILGFLKAFSFSWCAAGIWFTFGRVEFFLLLFSDLCAVPLYCLFALRSTTAATASRNFGLPVCMIVVLIAVCADVLFISPLLAAL